MVRSYSTKRMARRWPLVLFYNMIDVSAINAFIIWQGINHENGNICGGKEESFWSVLEKNCVELQKKYNLLHKFLQPEKGMLLLLEMVLHWIREPDVLCVTEGRTENVDLFVLDVANMYVFNTRTLSASTALSLILLLLLFLFSFVFICKCVQGLCYYLCLFASGLVVCVGGYLCETQKQNQ